MTISTDSKVWPDVAIPPGETLAEELDARGLAVADFATSAGLARRTVSEILAGRRSITVETAIRLEAGLGVEASFWMNLQTDYDLTLARLREAAASALPR